MKKRFSTVVTAIIVVAVIVGLIAGGLALLCVGDTPIHILFCNLLGLILFLIGGLAAIVLLVCLILVIPDYVNPPNKKNWLPYHLAYQIGRLLFAFFGEKLICILLFTRIKYQYAFNTRYTYIRRSKEMIYQRNRWCSKMIQQ